MKKKLVSVILAMLAVSGLNVFAIPYYSSHIKYNGDVVITNRDVLDEIKTGDEVYAACKLKLRSAGNRNATPTGVLEAGEFVTVLQIDKSAYSSIDGISSCWVEVQNESKKGWCFGGYLNMPLSVQKYIKPDGVNCKIKYTWFANINDYQTSVVTTNTRKDTIYQFNGFAVVSVDEADSFSPKVVLRHGKSDTPEHTLVMYDLEKGTHLPFFKTTERIEFANVDPEMRYLMYTTQRDKNINGYFDEVCIYLYDLKQQKQIAMRSFTLEHQVFAHYIKYNSDTNRLEMTIKQYAGGKTEGKTYYTVWYDIAENEFVYCPELQDRITHLIDHQ